MSKMRLRVVNVVVLPRNRAPRRPSFGPNPQSLFRIADKRLEVNYRPSQALGTGEGNSQ